MNAKQCGRLTTAIVVTAGSLYLSACGRKENRELERLRQENKALQMAKEVEALKKATVKGSVFIVTKGGTNYKLGLVTVKALRAESLNKYLDTTFRSLGTDLLELKRNYQTVLSSMDGDMASFQMALLDYQQAVKLHTEWKTYLEKFATLFESTSTIMKKYDADDSQYRQAVRGLLAAEAGVVRQGAALQPFYDRMKPASERAEDIYRKMHRIVNRHMDVVFAAMPAEEIAKTDADGAFKLTLPKTSDYFLVATAQRETGNQTETYYWLVPLTISASDEERSIMLSNDNQVESIPEKSNNLRAWCDSIPKTPDISELEIPKAVKNYTFQ